MQKARAKSKSKYIEKAWLPKIENLKFAFSNLKRGGNIGASLFPVYGSRYLFYPYLFKRSKIAFDSQTCLPCIKLPLIIALATWLA
jgi:hypothetical protein